MTNLDELKKDPAVLELYVKRIPLHRKGKNWVGHCPFHDGDHESSFMVQADNMLYRCFGCSAGGSVIDFIKNFDKVSLREAITQVEQFMKNREWEKQKQQVEEVFKPLASATKTLVIPLDKYKKFEDSLVTSEAGKNWLKERGISYATAQALHVGFRENIGSLAGVDNPDINGGGWICFPSIRAGKVSSIKYRSIQKKSFCYQPGMETSLWNTETIDALEPVYLVEGETDACIMEQAGFKAVSLPSASYKVTPAEKDALLTADFVILAGDSDAAGTEAMTRLWNDMKERTYLLHWPEGLKDANDVFLKKCKSDVSVFRTLIEALTNEAKSRPMSGVYSLQETMLSSKDYSLADHPARLHFPWKSVDKMAILGPGSVLSLFATNTGMGKSCFVMNFSVDAARHGEIVLNYQCEMSLDEFSTMVTAYLLHKDRNRLTVEDHKKAATLLAGTKYYIGRDTSLATVTPVLDLIEVAIRRLGVTVAILDHLHFVCRNEENEIQAQANAFQRIKNMAVNYGVKFIVVLQPRKADQSNKAKPTHLTDPKGSESLTSDADAVMALHRDWIKFIDRNNPPRDRYEPQTRIELHKARFKGEGLAAAFLYFNGAEATFYELAASDNLGGTEVAKETVF